MGAGEEAHADGVRQGADDGGDDEDDEDGVADVLEEELCVDDAEEREEEDEDRKLKADAEAEDDGEEEAGVVLDGEDGVEVVCRSPSMRTSRRREGPSDSRTKLRRERGRRWRT